MKTLKKEVISGALTMIKRESKVVLIILVIFVLPCFSDISGWVNTGLKTTNNVYSDSRNYSDLGYTLGAGLELKTKAGKRTYFSLGYSLDTKGFLGYNLENEVFGSFYTAIKSSALEGLEMELKAGYDNSFLLNAALYNYSNLNLKPGIKYYFLDHTAFLVRFSYEDLGYKDYNLDNKMLALKFGVEQEISVYDILFLSGSYGRADYTEKNIYSDIAAGIPSYESTLRADFQKVVEMGYSREFSTAFGIDIFYRYELFLSNDNYIEWGPNQYETSNTIIGDETLVQDYRTYEDNTLGLKLRVTLAKSRLNLSGSYGIKSFSGRVIKDAADILSAAREKRNDKLFVLSGVFTTPLPDEYRLNIGISFESNNSNDALYNYSKISISTAIEYSF